MTIPCGVWLEAPSVAIGCSSCCCRICCCNNFMLPSRAATLSCQVKLSVSSSFSFPLPQKRTDSCTCGFRFKLSRQPFQVTVVLSVSRHRLCVTVVAGGHFVMGQQVISTQMDGVGFLAVGTFAFCIPEFL